MLAGSLAAAPPAPRRSCRRPARSCSTASTSIAVHYCHQVGHRHAEPDDCAVPRPRSGSSGVLKRARRAPLLPPEPPRGVRVRVRGRRRGGPRPLPLSWPIAWSRSTTASTPTRFAPGARREQAVGAAARGSAIARRPARRRVRRQRVGAQGPRAADPRPRAGARMGRCWSRARATSSATASSPARAGVAEAVRWLGVTERRRRVYDARRRVRAAVAATRRSRW